MIRHNIQQDIFEKIFKDHSIKIQVFLRGQKVKGQNYDKFRDVGYEKELQNPIFIDAMQKTVSSNSLIIREIGLIQSGAIQIIVKDNDLSFIKLAEKILINDVEYTPFIKALGSRIQIEKLPFNYHKIILFIYNT